MKFNQQTIKITLASLVLLKFMSGGIAFAQDADEMPLSLKDSPALTPIQALEKALLANPDATAYAVELVKEEGTLRYDVELDNDTVVVVDANNGKIIATEQGE